MASGSGEAGVGFRGGSVEHGYSSLEETPLLRDSSPRVGKYGSLDEALDGMGVGVFHILLVFLCGWAIASDSVEIQCISFVTPQLDSSSSNNQNHSLKLDKSKEGILDAIIFLGMMVGGYMWGSLSDLIGRRPCLVTSLTVNGAFGLASAFSPNYPLFLVFRFLSGVGVGGSFPVVFSYFSEFFSRRSRGPFIIILAAFWILGSLYASFMAWIIIGNFNGSIHGRLGAMAIPAWRVYVIVCTFPCLSSALCFLLLPESPAFLLSKDKLEKAAKVLKKMQLFNACCGRSKEVSEVSVWRNCLRAMRSDSSSDEGEKRKGVCARIGVLFLSTRDLFLPAYLRAMVVLLIVWFLFSFGYYGLLLWFPEYFKYIERCNYQRDHNCSFADGSHDTSCSTSLLPCNRTTDSGSSDIYLDSLYVALAGIPGTVIGILTVNIVGPKAMLAVSLVVSGISTLLIWVIPDQQKSEQVIVILSSVFGGVSIIGWNALDVVTTSELFPTNLRSTAFGLQAVLGRIGAIIGNISFGKLFETGGSPYLPILIVASSLIFAGFSTLFLPTPRGDKTGCHRLRTVCMFCCRHWRIQYRRNINFDE